MTTTYKVKVHHEVFDVDLRYTNLQLIGRGAYGAVASAYDNKHKQKVAIKKIHDVFDDIIKAKRILREIKLLRHLNGHENIIQIHDVMVSPQNTKKFSDVYIVTKLFDADLDDIISSKQPLTKQHLQFFLYQILRGMKYIHSAEILHRDLKPSNILVNANCDVAICDFGLANAQPTDVDACMTEYVVTRYYRAPELLCEAKQYDKSVDVWSIGCCFAELICQRPFFRGKSPLQQLKAVVEILPCPPSEELEFAKHPVVKKVIDDCRNKSGVTSQFSDYFQGVDKRAIDLLSRMLVIKPDDR